MTDFIADNKIKKQFVMISSNVWLGKPIYRIGFLVTRKSYTPIEGGHRTNIHTIEESRHIKHSRAKANALKMIKKVI